MDNPEKMATYGTQDKDKTRHNMFWAPLFACKHKYRK